MRPGYIEMLRCGLAFMFALVVASSGAQSSVNFTIPAQVCIGESVSIVNDTPAGSDPKWSFCSTTNGTHVGETNGSIAPSMSGISMVEYNGDWFGLAVTRDGFLFR